MFENSSIISSINSIYKTFSYNIQNAYSFIPDNKRYEIVDNLLKIHGLSKENFSVIKNIEEIIVNNINDISIDDNSNKGEKVINGLVNESLHPFRKVVGYRFLYRKLKEIYGKQHAKFLTGLLYDYSLALSDSVNILIPYCWAFDSSKIVTIGKPFGQLPSKPVKRIDSYMSLLNEIVHQMSNHLAGAIAIGTFFLDIAHLLLIKENKTIDDLKNSDYRKYITNQFQRIVHGFNSLSRSAALESPFTNISIFDREKLKKFIIDDYNWYFYNEDGDLVYEVDYIVEFIIELQNIFMEFFDKGDPSNQGLPYRFPVVTINISKKDNDDIIDKKFLKSVCKKDIYRYNIFVSDTNKIASCCRLLSDKDMITLASQVNSFGAGSSVSLGSHRVVTLNLNRYALLSSSEKDFYDIIKQYIYYAKQILFAHKKMLYDLKDLQLFIKIGWIQLERMFSTIGLLGYNEAYQTLIQKYNLNISYEDFLYSLLTFINSEVNSNNENFEGCIFNIEQIPGESMSHRLARADALLFDNDKISYMYANQFIPLWDNNKNIFERMIIDGKCMKLITGGGITHLNTGEHITSQQAENLVKFAIKSGCEHFAVTGTFIQCEDNHVLFGNNTMCPMCGKNIIKKMARVVGFWVNVSDMSFFRRELDHEKRKEYKNGDFNLNEKI